jgi:hypothetical protein
LYSRLCQHFQGALPSGGSENATESSGSRNFAAELGALGYPGVAHIKREIRWKPAEVLLDALNESDLDARVAEGLPWLELTFVDMDRDWLVQNTKRRDRKYRLGFAVSLAWKLAEGKTTARGFKSFGRV